MDEVHTGGPHRGQVAIERRQHTLDAVKRLKLYRRTGKRRERQHNEGR
jgi:hypothetical protein